MFLPNPYPADPPFTPEQFARADPMPDGRFYAEPRLVTHIDDTAIAIIGQVLRDLIRPGDAILDLMSSWKSHLPPGAQPGRVVGVGMNAVELAANEQLDAWVVRDLNADPTLPFAGDEFDLAIITVSIQYVVRPLTLFREVRRVLKAGGALVVIFSNRLFPTKAVRIWQETDDAGHLALVRHYFELAGGFGAIRFIDRGDPPLQGRRGWAPQRHDPVYVVIGTKEPDGAGG